MRAPWLWPFASKWDSPLANVKCSRVRPCRCHGWILGGAVIASAALLILMALQPAGLGEVCRGQISPKGSRDQSARGRARRRVPTADPRNVSGVCSVVDASSASRGPGLPSSWDDETAVVRATAAYQAAPQTVPAAYSRPISGPPTWTPGRAQQLLDSP